MDGRMSSSELTLIHAPPTGFFPSPVARSSKIRVSLLPLLILPSTSSTWRGLYGANGITLGCASSSRLDKASPVLSRPATSASPSRVRSLDRSHKQSSHGLCNRIL